MAYAPPDWRQRVRWILTEDHLVAIVEYQGRQLGHVRYDGEGQWSARHMGGIWKKEWGRSKWRAARRLVQAFHEFEG